MFVKSTRFKQVCQLLLSLIVGYCNQILINYLNLKFNHILNSVTLRFFFPFMDELQ